MNAELRRRLAFWAIGCLIAAITRNERYHKTWAVVFPGGQIIYMALNLLHLG